MKVHVSSWKKRKKNFKIHTYVVDDYQERVILGDYRAFGNMKSQN